MSLGEDFIFFVCGAIFCFGLELGGAAHHSFLRAFDVGSSSWAGIVFFACSLVPGLLYFRPWRRISAPSSARPLFGTDYTFASPTAPPDVKLLFGSVLFGLGWALGGFCPGPSVGGMLVGDPVYCAFSYGMYFLMVSRHFWLARTSQPPVQMQTASLLMTAGLGLIPMLCYLFGPVMFPMNAVVDVKAWPLKFSTLGGLIAGSACVLMCHFHGRARVLGLSGTWRNVLDPRQSVGARLKFLMFFLGYVCGSIGVYFVFPAAFVPPFQDRPLWAVFFGGAAVMLGVEFASGCTTGHGICGVSRFSYRSITSVVLFISALSFGQMALRKVF